MQLGTVPQAPGDATDEHVPRDVEELQIAATGATELVRDGTTEAVPNYRSLLPLREYIRITGDETNVRSHKDKRGPSCQLDHAMQPNTESVKRHLYQHLTDKEFPAYTFNIPS